MKKKGKNQYVECMCGEIIKGEYAHHICANEYIEIIVEINI